MPISVKHSDESSRLGLRQYWATALAVHDNIGNQKSKWRTLSIMRRRALRAGMNELGFGCMSTWVLREENPLATAALASVFFNLLIIDGRPEHEA